MIGIKTLETIKELLNSELNATRFKEASGGSDYSDHKNKVQGCIDAVDQEIMVVRRHIRWMRVRKKPIDIPDKINK